MEKYDKLAKDGRWGGSNLYNYVFHTVLVTPIDLKSFFVEDVIATRLENALTKLPDSTQKDQVLKRISIIKKINSTIQRIK